MSEPASALGGAVSEGFARIEELPPRGMIALRGDLDATEIQLAASEVAGVPMPGKLRAEFGAGGALCWMAPDEVLLMCDYAEVPARLAALSERLTGMHHLAADMSDARTLFRITGLDAREALAKLTPADLSPAAFGPGAFRRTRLAQAPAAIWMRDDADSESEFGVMCFRSVARYMFDLLTNAAARGSEVGHWRD